MLIFSFQNNNWRQKNCFHSHCLCHLNCANQQSPWLICLETVPVTLNFGDCELHKQHSYLSRPLTQYFASSKKTFSRDSVYIEKFNQMGIQSRAKNGDDNFWRQLSNRARTMNILAQWTCMIQVG